MDTHQTADERETAVNRIELVRIGGVDRGSGGVVAPVGADRTGQCHWSRRPIVGGWPIFHEAWENVRDRRMTMELSMTIALVAALLIGEFSTALIITGFVLVAEVLDGMTAGRGRRAIQDLLDFLPAMVAVRRPTGTLRIPLGEVHIGDLVLVAPGECIAVDGRVRTGHSNTTRLKKQLVPDPSRSTGQGRELRRNTGES